MGPDQTVAMMRELLTQAMILCAPLLLSAAAISLLVSLLQTLTSVQEQTLTAVPRLLVVFVVAMVSHALDDSSAGGVYGAAAFGLSPVYRMTDGPWEQSLTDYFGAGVLVAVRLSGLMVFAPVFNSSAIAPRVKAGFVFGLTVLLAPVVAAVPGAKGTLDVGAILGELGVGMVFGLSLMMLTEALTFAGTLLGQSFSFSLVNLLDPNTMVETAVLGQLLGWLGTLVLIGAGLDRVLLAAMVRSFMVVPAGNAVFQAATGAALAKMAAGIFLAGLQLAAPVMAAALAVEVTVSLVSRLAPQLPVQVVGVPLKTMSSYVVLIGSLAVWPGWIEQHFTALLDAAEGLLVRG